MATTNTSVTNGVNVNASFTVPVPVLTLTIPELVVSHEDPEPLPTLKPYEKPPVVAKDTPALQPSCQISVEQPCVQALSVQPVKAVTLPPEVCTYLRYEPEYPTH